MNEKAMQIAMILDRSGSMSSIEGATVEGMNAFIRDQQEGAASLSGSEVDVDLLLVQFDDHYEQVYSGSIDGAPMLTLAEKPIGNQVRFVPRGSTALLDAMGKTIDEVGRKLAGMDEQDRPGKVVIVTMTDGHENHSRIYTHHQIGDMIQRQREVYKWEFQFLAANQDAISTASAINIPAANAITYLSSGGGVRNVMASASRNIRDYGAARVAGAAMPAMPGFKKQDREAAVAEEPEKAVTNQP